MASIDQDEPKKKDLYYMQRTTLKTHLKRGLVIFVVIKIVMGLQNVIFQKPTFENLASNFTLEDIYDDERGTFTLLDKQEVRFTQAR
jgi:hypothetical protein